MNVIRKLKLSEIIDVEWSIEEKEIIDLFDYWLKDLVVFIDPDRLYETNYMKADGTWVLQQDEKNEKLLVRYHDFWEVLELKYQMKYVDIQSLVKTMVERAFKQQVYTSLKADVADNEWVERAFKQQVYTSSCDPLSLFYEVERVFKQQVYTSIIPKATRYQRVERAFKQQVYTPIKTFTSSSFSVERAFKQQVYTPQASIFGTDTGGRKSI